MSASKNPRELVDQCAAELATLATAAPIKSRDAIVREVNGALGDYAGIRSRSLRRFLQSQHAHLTSVAREIQALCDDFLNADAKRRGIQR